MFLYSEHNSDSDPAVLCATVCMYTI